MPESENPKHKRARAWVLAHPTDSKEMQAVGARCSTAMIAMVRRELVAEGLITRSRKAIKPPEGSPKGYVALVEPDETTPTVPVAPASVLDHEAMKTLAGITDLDDLDDDAIYRRMLKQCVRFTFDPNLHPDTRMSASQMYHKLKAMAKEKDLGPGVPVTRIDVRNRLADLMRACGADVTLEAINIAFDVKEEPLAQETHDQAEAPGGIEGAPGPTGHPSDPEAPEVVRSIDMDGGSDTPDAEDLGHPDLPGPPA